MRGIKSDEQPFCFCGCGQPTRRWKDGSWPRFIPGHQVRVRPSVSERFWARVQKSEGDGCWNWTGAVGTPGYPLFEDQYRQIAGHRWIWEQNNGPIPTGMHVCHRCDNPRCVRPDHLFLGTPKDNFDDMVAKGRSAHLGSRNGRARLTNEQAREIRSRFAAGGTTLTALGGSFHISRTAISRIVQGFAYRDA